MGVVDVVVVVVVVVVGGCFVESFVVGFEGVSWVGWWEGGVGGPCFVGL